MKERFLIFFLIVILSYLYEKINVKCKRNSVGKQLFSFIHHCISIWLILGTFIFNRFHLLHLFFLTFVVAHWFLMETATGVYGCYLSRLYNDVCGLPYDDKFIDIFSVLNEPITISLYAFIVLYDMYFISKGNI